MFLITTFLLLSFQNLVTAEYIPKEKTIVLYDDGHREYLNTTRFFTQAINDLNNSDEFLFYSLDEGWIDEKTLEGADILILNNPKDMEAEEISSIFEFVKKGGNLLLMNDPTTANYRHANSYHLNRIILKLEKGQILPMFQSRGNVIKDGLHNLKDNITEIVLTSEMPEAFQTHPITDNISRLLVFSACLDVEPETTIIGQCTNTSYAEDTTGDKLCETSPPWLVAFTLNSSRIILSGSSIMFSDFKVPELNTTFYTTWDNAKLWRNMMLWLSGKQTNVAIKIIPLSGFYPIYLGILGGILIVSGMGFYFLFRGREPIPISEIIQIVRKKKKVEKIEEEIKEIEKVEEKIKEEKLEKEEKIEEERKPPPKKVKVRKRSERRRRGRRRK